MIWRYEAVERPIPGDMLDGILDNGGHENVATTPFCFFAAELFRDNIAQHRGSSMLACCHELRLHPTSKRGLYGSYAKRGQYVCQNRAARVEREFTLFRGRGVESKEKFWKSGVTRVSGVSGLGAVLFIKNS